MLSFEAGREDVLLAASADLASRAWPCDSSFPFNLSDVWTKTSLSLRWMLPEYFRPPNSLAFSRTGRQNLNRGKVDADAEMGKTVKPGVGLERWVSWTGGSRSSDAPGMDASTPTSPSLAGSRPCSRTTAR